MGGRWWTCLPTCAGHGRRMLRLIHRLAEQQSAFEVTVEDPAPGYRALRDAVDISRAVAHCRSIAPTDSTDSTDSADTIGEGRKGELRPCGARCGVATLWLKDAALNADDIAAARRCLRITKVGPLVGPLSVRRRFLDSTIRAQPCAARSSSFGM